MKIGAVINKASGTLPTEKQEKLLDVIKELLELRVSPGCLSIVSEDRIELEIKRMAAKGVEVLAVGGGDGTISAAARFVENKGIALAVIGMGTKNNFARDLGIPEEPEEAIRLLDHLRIKKIDMGEVNGFKFINNATIGVYPEIVDKRDEAIRKKGWKKWSAHFAATGKVLWNLRRMRLAIKDENQGNYQFIPFLFVGNNEYQGKNIAEFSRKSLDGGKLWFCKPITSGKWQLFLMAVQISMRGFRHIENLETSLRDSFTVHSLKRILKVAIDGENYNLETPLRFKIHPKNLRVVMP